MPANFIEMFEESCFEGTAAYITERAEDDKLYQELLEQLGKVTTEMVNRIDLKDLVLEFEETSNALETFHQRWAYQKAFYDYTFLLRKMGILSLGEDQGMDFKVDKKTYHKLLKAADKKNISVERFIRQCFEFSIEHIEEMITEEKRENE